MYLDDLRLPRCSTRSFVRSPHAHAKIAEGGRSPALKLPRVVAALTGKDIDGKVKDMPTVDAAGSEKVDASTGSRATRPRSGRMLAIDEVNFAGEAVAVVFAETPYAAEDAAEAVEVEYEPLDAVVDVEIALSRHKSPKVHAGFPDNVAYHYVHRVRRRGRRVPQGRRSGEGQAPQSARPSGLARTEGSRRRLRRGGRSPHDMALHAGPPQPAEQPR